MRASRINVILLAINLASLDGSQNWSQSRVMMEMGDHVIEIRQYTARCQGPRSHGPWWETSSARQGGAEDVFDGTGGVIWDSGVVLCHALAGNLCHSPTEDGVLEIHNGKLKEVEPNESKRASPPATETSKAHCTDMMRVSLDVSEKSVVELGCGTGLVGILAAKQGARLVVVTDRPEQLALARNNALINSVGNGFTALPLPWGCSESLSAVKQDLGRGLRLAAVGVCREGEAIEACPDLVLGADIVYGQSTEVLDKLFSTIVGLCEAGRTRIVITHKHRPSSPSAAASDAFFSRCEEAFTLKVARVESRGGRVLIYDMIPRERPDFEPSGGVLGIK